MMMTMKTSCFALVSWFSFLRTTTASKDDSYYPAGVSNPNVNNEMYWKEPHNVLQDLDQFEKLYIEFHSCAWSEVLEVSNDDNNNNNNNNNQFSNLQQADGWYLGSVPPFGANVAYSLYGVLAGGSSRDHKGCTKQHYINSFVTTGGIESFTTALAQGGVENFQVAAAEDNNNKDDENEDVQVTSACQVPEGFELDYDDYYNDNNNNENNNGYEAVHRYTEGYTSYGVVCSSTNFVRAQFEGALCQGDAVVDVVNTLDDFNQDLQSTGCVAIYDRSVDDYSQQQQQQNDNNENDQQVLPVETLLQSSRTCDYRRSSCPDPHGKLARQSRALERATGSIDYFEQDHQRLRIVAWTFMALGLACLLGAAILVILELPRLLKNKKRNKKNKKKSLKKDNKPEEPTFTKPSVETTPKTRAGRFAAAVKKTLRPEQYQQQPAETSQEVVLDDDSDMSPPPSSSSPLSSSNTRSVPSPKPQTTTTTTTTTKRSSSLFGRLRRGRSRSRSTTQNAGI